MATNPTLLTQPIAANGAKNAIPNTTSTVGAMSQDQGFPAETALPLGAGGVAPSREDFNGAFNLLSGIAFMAQKGWVFLFDENQDYFAGCTVRDPLDNKIYEAINDISASNTHPSDDSVNWKLGTDMSAYTTTINSPMFNKRDSITTSGTYTAPVTGWYKITAKGGGGGGGAGNWDSSTEYTAGGGGGEGGTTITYVSMTAGDTATVLIGAGGTGGATGSNPAGSGGNTTVTIDGNTYTAGGGCGGYPVYSGGNGYGVGGAGGTGTINGCAGGSGQRINTNIGAIAGSGGGTGGGTGGGIYNTPTPTAGTQGGGGGAGSAKSSSSQTGMAGGNGYVWFEYFDSSLNS
jgi:hypothetical protein